LEKAEEINDGKHRRVIPLSVIKIIAIKEAIRGNIS